MIYYIQFDKSSSQGPNKVLKFIEKITDIEQLDIGHVAFLKGESWKGNNGSGLVHRSPHEDKGYKRLYMTIDFLETYINIYTVT